MDRLSKRVEQLEKSKPTSETKIGAQPPISKDEKGKEEEKKEQGSTTGQDAADIKGDDKKTETG